MLASQVTLVPLDLAALTMCRNLISLALYVFLHHYVGVWFL